MKMNVPNILSITRFLMTIVIVVLMVIPFQDVYVIPTTGFNVIDLVCCVLFIIASITDTLDGTIARKHNLVTNFGKFIDPLADKALVNSAFILLACYKSSFLPVIIPILMILRDLAVDGVRFLAAKQGEVIAANVYGKAKTVSQMIVIPFIFLNGFPLNYLLGEQTYIFTIIIACIALALSWISGGIYLYRGRKYIID